jgi:hypothetical protein
MDVVNTNSGMILCFFRKGFYSALTASIFEPVCVWANASAHRFDILAETKKTSFPSQKLTVFQRSFRRETGMKSRV